METSVVDKSVQKEIEDIVLLLINNNADDNGISKSETLDGLIDNLRSSSFFKIDKTNKENFIKLSNVLLPVAESMLQEDIAFCEFPFNVRVSHATAPTSYLLSDFPTDALHCDPWYGEPKNSTNFLYYVYISESSSFVDFYQTGEKDVEKLKSFSGKYQLFDWNNTALERYPKQVEMARLIMFDSYTPHKTVRSGTDIRISIDFRVIRKQYADNIKFDNKVINKYYKKGEYV